MEPERLVIEFGADAVADLREGLGRTRWPGDYGNDDWRYGANQDWMQARWPRADRRTGRSTPAAGGISRALQGAHLSRVEANDSQ